MQLAFSTAPRARSIVCTSLQGSSDPASFTFPSFLHRHTYIQSWLWSLRDEFIALKLGHMKLCLAELQRRIREGRHQVYGHQHS